jgi:hypothetical protein
MKRDIKFLWTSGQAPGEPRIFLIRVGQGSGEMTMKISEEEAKELFDQMGEYKKDWNREATK